MRSLISLGVALLTQEKLQKWEVQTLDFENVHPTRYFGVLMFVYIPGMSNGFYLAYAYVTYIIWGSLYSTVNIPYGSMASVITGDPVERTSLSSWRTLGGQLAGLIINVVGPMILFVNNRQMLTASS